MSFDFDAWWEAHKPAGLSLQMSPDELYGFCFDAVTAATEGRHPECGNMCGDHETYGFVPEAGCKVHD